MPEVNISKTCATLVQALVESGLCKSNGEARRLIEQGGVSVNGERAADANMPLPAGDFTLFKGKKVRVRAVRV